MCNQLLIDMQTSCGVEHIDVIAPKACLSFGPLCNGDRILTLYNGQGINPNLDAENLQLLHRSGAVHIKGGHQDTLAFAFFQPFGELCCCCGFTRPLQTHHQDGGRRAVNFEGTWVFVTRKYADQLVMDNFDNLLTRRHGFGDRLTRGFILDGLDKISGNRKRDICFQKRDAHFTKSSLYIIFRERTLFGQPIKDTREAFR